VVAKADAFTARVLPTIEALRADGKSLHQIAAELNGQGRDDGFEVASGMQQGCGTCWFGGSRQIFQNTN
jgi:hypothetical protein